ncbi:MULTISPECIES: flagellin [unclassified Chelatococcus]|uniref:flagellin N-terminal helical domain-containing protein n=1 Tax=unclassified Chelatococcus TaxID=2638111 RepID=UPI00031058CB|nr:MULTISPECIES: flagellin [unclassified Chelatococcus]ALA16768.1 flagellin [Chelatococcus sp. CO-6]
MSSLLTNASAMTALQTLTATNKNLAGTQNRISTGLRVSTASDNAAYWSIATTMKSDNAALSAVKDAIGLGAATIDTMYTALDTTKEIVTEIKKKLVAARDAGVDRAKVQTEISDLQNQLKASASSAVFNGENWLDVDSSAADYNNIRAVVASFSRAGGVVTIDKIDIDISKMHLFDANGNLGIFDLDRSAGFSAGGNIAGTSVSDFDISGVTNEANDLADLEGLTQAVDDALQELTDAASYLGSIKNRVDIQNDFVNALSDAITRGIGQLVDANMEEESTKLQALQVQQQLGIQALSIANSSMQNVLSLFRG